MRTRQTKKRGVCLEFMEKGLWLWCRVEWQEGYGIRGFCLQDLNREGSRKEEGKIGRAHMASSSWNSLKHVHFMLVAWGSVCTTSLRVDMSMDGVAGRIG